MKTRKPFSELNCVFCDDILIIENKNGSAEELQLFCTCAGADTTYTTGIPAPQGQYNAAHAFPQGEIVRFSSKRRVGIFDLHDAFAFNR